MRDILNPNAILVLVLLWVEAYILIRHWFSEMHDVISDSHVWLCGITHSWSVVSVQHWRRWKSKDRVQQAIAKCVYFMLAKSIFALPTEILAVESSQLIFGASARLLLYLATCQISSLGYCKASIFSWFASENRCAWHVCMAALHEEIQEQGMLMKNWRRMNERKMWCHIQTATFAWPTNVVSMEMGYTVRLNLAPLQSLTVNAYLWGVIIIELV